METRLIGRTAGALAVGLAAVIAGCSDALESPLDVEEGSVQAFRTAPVRNAGLIPITAGPGNWVVDAAGNETTDPDDLLWYRDPFVSPLPPAQPLLAPDGHQVTLGELTAARGRVSVKCTEMGTHLTAHFSGLLAKGVYTLWLALWNEPIGTDPTNIFRGLYAVGAAGPQDGSQNAFRASADGQGQVSLMIEEGPLTFVPGRLNDDCVYDDPDVAQFHLVGAYHVDGQTHGGNPGPRIEPFLFIFDNPPQ